MAPQNGVYEAVSACALYERGDLGMIEAVTYRQIAEFCRSGSIRSIDALAKAPRVTARRESQLRWLWVLPHDCDIVCKIRLSGWIHWSCEVQATVPHRVGVKVQSDG